MKYYCARCCMYNYKVTVQQTWIFKSFTLLYPAYCFHSIALLCMHLITELNDKLHWQHNRLQTRKVKDEFNKSHILVFIYICLILFKVINKSALKLLELVHEFVCVDQGVLRYICRAGVKIRTVPSIDTVRKAHRKILSSTCATNFQSWTTWMRQSGRDRDKKEMSTGENLCQPQSTFLTVKTTNKFRTQELLSDSFISSFRANETNNGKELLTISSNLSYEVLLFDVPAYVANWICSFLQHGQPGLVLILLPCVGASLLAAGVARNPLLSPTSAGL